VKYAFMSFSMPGATLPEVLQEAQRLGYDGFEPRVAGKPGQPGHAHGIELARTPRERRGIRRQFASSGVSLCCLALGTSFADPQTVEANVEETRRYLTLAHDVGARCVRVFGGRLPAGSDRSAAIGLLVDALLQLAPEARDAGVPIVLETHDDWCDPTLVADVMRRTNHPAVGVNWDVMHPVRFGLATMRESFDLLRPWIRHVHIHDGLNTPELNFRAFGEGEYDLRSAFGSLLAMGYAGFLSGEWIDCPGFIELATEIDRMRRFEAACLLSATPSP
jgi:sugar phosphate isomerase/epimerase